MDIDKFKRDRQWIYVKQAGRVYKLIELPGMWMNMIVGCL